MIRRLAAVLALIAIGSVLPGARPPVHAASWYEGPCTDNVGITVVVDFHELGGGVNVRSAPGPAATGLAALDNSGISWEGTQRFPGIVCRIAGKPGPDVEPCANTPPGNAYWSYWIAPRGGPWCYSTTGAGNRTPPPGSIEGWSFALTQNAVDIPPPGYDPPAPVPGETPNPLKRSDCATSSAATPTTTAAPTALAPTPTIAIAQPATPPSPTDVPPPVAETPTATVVNAVGGPSSTTLASTTLAAPSIATTSTNKQLSTSTIEPGNESATSSRTDDTGSAQSVSPTPTADSAVAFGAVDLGDDGRGDDGFGSATAVGIAVAASLGGAGAWAARRRRAVT